ncbi:GNAT family N-acetyltransferase [Achromobacter ruhlandii]|uniref:GNAT family N-acetyltransferase n=1 Tax=Achromobacter ruhlandii TaxID=72557 RepID=UPI000665AE08|nr:GNAT family N-acetyltransferase [Achromobacter ruhlandii]MCZ8431171.1 GNAT family N-acetyltransferase [Achromobacter ruhlandii]MDC6087478.1 GNAT family N-acetyltransferase [Achromobacter ruhlandii]MDC6150607.1 GNAT family N-acetyltransferase [Achromobacter ruhlandii]MDD7979352.1 GNAT family N-acetyltransferase [Achromobacter ruhlandii]WIW04931.1 GNAT family N-acetyltransferase [Achromobacter ruhlandii]
MRFRPASLSDIPRLGQLALASKAHWGYSARQLEQWREDLTPRESWLDTGPFVVAENDAGVIGFYTLAAAGNGAWALENLWLDPKWIGQGFGRALFAHAVETAGQRGATVLTIDAEPHAEAFYLAQGARRTKIIPAPIDGDPHRMRPQLELAMGQTPANAGNSRRPMLS